MNPELEKHASKIIEESDSVFEAMIGLMLLYLIHVIFRAVELVVELGTDTKSTD